MIGPEDSAPVERPVRVPWIDVPRIDNVWVAEPEIVTVQRYCPIPRIPYPKDGFWSHSLSPRVPDTSFGLNVLPNLVSGNEGIETLCGRNQSPTYRLRDEMAAGKSTIDDAFTWALIGGSNQEGYFRQHEVLECRLFGQLALLVASK